MHDDEGNGRSVTSVVHLRGDIDLAAAPRVQRDLHRAIDMNPGAIVTVDLDGVTSIDPTGLGILVAALGRATAHRGDIVIVCNAESIRKQFKQCRLDRVFDID
jgi:anti-sigma B factor antagonist